MKRRIPGAGRQAPPRSALRAPCWGGQAAWLSGAFRQSGDALEGHLAAHLPLFSLSPCMGLSSDVSPPCRLHFAPPSPVPPHRPLLFRVHDNGGYGALIRRTGTKGRLENCEIWKNYLGGIVIDLGADPLMSSCRCAHPWAPLMRIGRVGYFPPSIFKDRSGTLEVVACPRGCAV